MAEKDIKWTDQQSRAISRRGSDVLVTASAGTGKTAVLSGCCVDIVSDAAADLGSMLVVTFTDAAAEQMRQRIREQLKRKLGLDKSNIHIQRQLLMLPAADVGTIHSFCKKLITEYFYILGIDPAFRVIDADEQTLVKSDCLEQTFEWAWEQGNLQGGLEEFFARRDSRPGQRLAQKIISVSDFLDSLVRRQDWFDKTLMFSEAVEPLKGPLGDETKRFLIGRLERIYSQLKYALQLYEKSSSLTDWSDKWRKRFAERVEKTIGLLRQNDWDKASELITAFERPTVSKPKDIEDNIADLLRKTIKDAVDAFGELRALVFFNPDYLNRVSVSQSRQVKVLAELVKQFELLYSQAKRAANCMDFADLERYALELLTEQAGSGSAIVPSQTALSIRKKYKYIFVDEYQDINPVQQAILKAVSSGDNIFVVGDVKQSIYAFRGSEPKIFLENLKSASIKAADLSRPFRVDLNINFRSAGPLLDFVNRLFGRIMTKTIADIDYDESAALRPADESQNQPCPVPAVELHILEKGYKSPDEAEQQDSQDESAEQGQAALTSRQVQAVMIAQRIKQIVGAETGKAEFQVFDQRQNCLRDVQYGDIVVLMRSPVGRINDYVRFLRLAGIPTGSSGTDCYFEATEISDMLSLLKVLDNPQRDIELAAVLRSPIFGFSDSDLARIKIFGKDKVQCRNFYDCVLAYCANGLKKELAGKLSEAVKTLNIWRHIAAGGSIADLIWQILQQMRLLSFFSALPSGPQRRANLVKLHDRAIQFESFATSGCAVSLGRFVDFVERLQQAEGGWVSAEQQGNVDNTVRVMSVHKSKGLEFPVVFLAELDGQFNTDDCFDDILVDNELGIGLAVVDRLSNTKMRSAAHQVIAERKMATMLAEEMRILYVATTRAKYKLILTAAARRKFCRDALLDFSFFGGHVIDGWRLTKSRSFLEWILLALSDQKSLHEIFETGLEQDAGESLLFKPFFYGEEEIKQFSKYVEDLRRFQRPAIGQEKGKKTEADLLLNLKKSLGWSYRFEDISKLPAKRTVTQISHGSDVFFKLDYSKVLERKPIAVAADSFTETVDSRLVGIATHTVLSRIDLTQAVTKERIAKITSELLGQKIITPPVAECIDVDSILNFFESELGKLAADKRNIVFREWPFTFAIPASELPESDHEPQIMSDEQRVTSDELIVVQGMIDLLIRTDSGLVIIDFKTDNITADRCFEHSKTYHTQLNLYAMAAGNVFGLKVLKKCLYYLKPRRLVEVC